MSVASRVFFAVLIGVWLAPLAWIIVISAGPPQGFANAGGWVGTLDNYSYLLREHRIDTVGNSLIMGAITAIFAVTLGFIGAYFAVSRASFASRALLWWLLILKVLPGSAIAIAAFLLIAGGVLEPSRFLAGALIAVSTAFFSFLFFRVALDQVPRMTIPSLRIDGWRDYRIMLYLLGGPLLPDLLGVTALFFLIGRGEE